jgi:hypothetical protein
MILQSSLSSITRIPCLDSRTTFTQTISETHTQQQTRQEGSFRVRVTVKMKVEANNRSGASSTGGGFQSAVGDAMVQPQWVSSAPITARPDCLAINGWALD